MVLLVGKEPAGRYFFVLPNRNNEWNYYYVEKIPGSSFSIRKGHRVNLGFSSHSEVFKLIAVASKII